MTLGSRIRERREALGITQRQLAEHFGISRNAVSLWESDTNQPEPNRIAALAAFLGVNPNWLWSGEGPMDALPATNVEPAYDARLPARQSMSRDVPVRGVAEGGRDGEFTLNDAVDYVRRPAGIANLRGVEAVRVVGDSMEPWRFARQLVYFDTQPVNIGDHVIVEMKPKRPGDPPAAFIKRLVGRTPTKLRLKQYNPPDDRIEIPLSQIKAVYRVIELDELLGA